MLRALLEMLIFERLTGYRRPRGGRSGCLAVPGCGCFTRVVLLLLVILVVSSINR